jgi:hypothetical protein
MGKMRITIGLIFLIASMANAQTSLPGFMGIKFGTKPEDAKSALIAKGGIFDQVDSDSTRICFTNLKWGGYSTYGVCLACDDSLGIYQVTVLLKSEDMVLLQEYGEILGDLKVNFGEPANITRSFSAPYELGDGRELEAIQAGKRIIKDEWDFSDQNDLVMLIEKNDFICVVYENPDLLNRAHLRTHKKYSGDY